MGGDVERKSVSPAHAAVDSVATQTQIAEEIDATAHEATDEPKPATATVDVAPHNDERLEAAPSTDDGTTAAATVGEPEANRSVASIRSKVGDDDDSPVLVLAHRKWFRHVMVPRERVEQVAHRYGVTVEDLRTWNGLSGQTQRMRLGSRLRVFTARVPPHREKTAYTVAEGDTWWSVALRHGVDGRDIRAYNYPSRGKMTPGSRLQIWVDPIVHAWITEGGDPLPDDEAFALRRGGLSVGRPDAGWLVNGVRLPKGAGYHLRLPKSAYGSSHAVEQIMIGLTLFRLVSENPHDLELGAMSRARGGELGGHRSHQSGRDLDIRLPRRDGVPSWVELTRRRIDWLTTWHLVQAMLHADATAIFLDYAAQKQLHRAAKAAGVDRKELRRVLQYPDGRSAAGIVRHSPGHEKHMHIRVGCGPYEVECAE
ncbi:MAG: penicillin-insensitive murein endopeptidase [Nannocystaceae bacterium]|nr:penicillin-insensitive murein endopeptidase [Nannocystaceae bacterium]